MSPTDARGRQGGPTPDLPQGSHSRFVHSARARKDAWHALVVPIYRSVSYHQADPETSLRYDYARSGNPTREALETAIRDLEGGAAGFAFASGNAALTAALLLLRPGDHLIVTRDCQGGTQRLLRVVFGPLGLRWTFVDTDDVAAVQAAREERTKAVLVENFSNPFLRTSDVPALARCTRSAGLLLIVDNTLLTPYLQTPLRLGADIVVHSATKMISGHQDVTAGLAVTADAELGRRLYSVQNATGIALSPDDCHLVLRGLRTLPLRMERAMASAGHLAEWLARQPEIEDVYYPGNQDAPGHAAALQTAAGFGNLVTVRLGRPDLVPPLVRALRFIQVGAGFGGTETSISLPPLHCHAALTPEERAERRLFGDLLRISVGLEDAEDIVQDLRQALDAAVASV